MRFRWLSALDDIVQNGPKITLALVWLFRSTFYIILHLFIYIIYYIYIIFFRFPRRFLHFRFQWPWPLTSWPQSFSSARSTWNRLIVAGSVDWNNGTICVLANYQKSGTQPQDSNGIVQCLSDLEHRHSLICLWAASLKLKPFLNYCQLVNAGNSITLILDTRSYWHPR